MTQPLLLKSPSFPLYISLPLLLFILSFLRTVSSRPNTDHRPKHREERHRVQKHAQYHHVRHADYKWLDIKDIPGVNDNIIIDPNYKTPGHPVEKILGSQPLYVSITTIKAR